MLQKDSLFRRRDEARPRFTQDSPAANNGTPAAAPAAVAPAPYAEAPKSAPKGERKEAKLIVGPDIKMKGVEVADCDAAAARASELGARIQVGPTTVEPGRYAVLADPTGARLGIITPDPVVRRSFRTAP